MSAIPEIGAWFRSEEGDRFEVVAFDPHEQVIEVQFYDGTVEEYDFEEWEELNPRPATPPKDWAGSLDVSGDDYGVDLDRPAGETRVNPLDDLDSSE